MPKSREWGAQKTPEVIVHAEEIMKETPKTAIREIHQQINLSVRTIHKLLRITAVQELLPGLPTKIRILQLVVNIMNINRKYT